MSVPRNIEWTIQKGLGGNYSYDQAQLAVLMDIRDELRKLNRLLGCQNFVEVPTILRGIRRNTTKSKRFIPGRKPRKKAKR